MGDRAGGSLKAPLALHTREEEMLPVLARVLVPRRPGDETPVADEPLRVTAGDKAVPAHQAIALRVTIGDARFLAALAYEPGDYACAGRACREGLMVTREP